MQAPHWVDVRMRIFEAIGSLQFAVEAETRCGDPHGLVAKWKLQIDHICRFAAAVQKQDWDASHLAWLELDAQSREKMPARLRAWVTQR